MSATNDARPDPRRSGGSSESPKTSKAAETSASDSEPRPKAKKKQVSTKASPAAPKRPRGRPKGSVSLTPEIADQIVALVQAGSFGYVAARAVGVPARTFHDWMARGRGEHPTRSSTPKLGDFAKRVDTAEAISRVGVETRIREIDPKHWLRYAARSKPGEEGWSDPARGSDASPGASLAHLSEDELASEMERLESVLIEAGELTTPACANPRCRCSLHPKRKGTAR